MAGRGAVATHEPSIAVPIHASGRAGSPVTRRRSHLSSKWVVDARVAMSPVNRVSDIRHRSVTETLLRCPVH